MNKNTLKELRESSGLLAKEVAKTLKITPRAYARYEQGTRRINIEQVLILAELYDGSERDVIQAQLNSCL